MTRLNISKLLYYTRLKYNILSMYIIQEIYIHGRLNYYNIYKLIRHKLDTYQKSTHKTETDVLETQAEYEYIQHISLLPYTEFEELLSNTIEILIQHKYIIHASTLHSSLDKKVNLILYAVLHLCVFLLMPIMTYNIVNTYYTYTTIMYIGARSAAIYSERYTYREW